MLMVLMIADWLDYPGFEAWRFINLFLFIAGCFAAHRWFGKPISEGLRRRRENIKLELESARQRRDAAAAELTVVEARLAEVDKEVAKDSGRGRSRSGNGTASFKSRHRGGDFQIESAGRERCR